MKNLKFEIDINADVRKVWSTMLERNTYEQWVRNAWPGSSYQGEFKKDNEVSFVGDDGSGTLAKITEYKPFETVKATHIAMLGPGGQRDTTSDMAKEWVGIEEQYFFAKKNDSTRLVIEMKNIPSEFEQMFADTWPVALKDLKDLCEN
jgi:hypothetical protein